MPAIARTLMRGVGALLLVALLVQFFIAGMAALTNPDWWAYHQKWVAIFQWLVVPLPVLAWLAGPPRRYRVTLACVPFIQIGLQYVLAHRAIDGRWPIGLGLHAVDAAVMLIVVVALVVDPAGTAGGIPSRDRA
ncbi:MAG TPA: DUF6220 domain-containing protein [Xanthobacteraceae bacterium]